MKTRKKLLSLLMVLCMVIAMMPTAASAEENLVSVNALDDFGTISSNYRVLESGVYTLQSDIVLDYPIKVPNGKTVTLDLNGHVLQGNGSQETIKNEGTLTLNDSKQDSVHYGTLENLVYTVDGGTRTDADAFWS